MRPLILKISQFVFMFLLANTSYGKYHGIGQFAYSDINIIGNSSKSKDTSRYIIRGKVYDSAFRQNIPYASISIQNRRSRYCNALGEFELKLPRKYLKKNFTLVVTSVGYTPVKIEIENKKSVLDTILTFYLPPGKDSGEIINTR